MVLSFTVSPMQLAIGDPIMGKYAEASKRFRTGLAPPPSAVAGSVMAPS